MQSSSNALQKRQKQQPFPPNKKRRINRIRNSSAATGSQPLGRDQSDRAFRKLASKQFVQLDNRVRALEGIDEDAVKLDKYHRIVTQMKQVGCDYNAAAQGKSMPPPHLYQWPEFCRGVHETFPENQALRQSLEQHAKQYDDFSKLGRDVRHCTVALSKREPTAVITIAVKHRLEPLWEAMKDAILTLPGAKEYTGPPPRGPMARIFSEMIDQS